MNLLAAKEIARQIRLRDLGGVIVNDFIDMRKEKHRRGVERALRDAMKRDRARTKILRTSPFGLIEMTRQRIRTNPKRSAYMECPSCGGSAVVKTPESMAIDVVRLLILASQREPIAKVTLTVSDDVADYPEQPQAARAGPARRGRRDVGANHRRRQAPPRSIWSSNAATRIVGK